MKSSSIAGLLLYSSATLVILVFLFTFTISLWEIIGLGYLLPFTLIGIFASIKNLIKIHQQKRCIPISCQNNEIFMYEDEYKNPRIYESIVS